MPCRYEFKFLLEHRSGHLEWENGSNRSFEVPKTAAELVVEGEWNRTEVRDRCSWRLGGAHLYGLSCIHFLCSER